MPIKSRVKLQVRTGDQRKLAKSLGLSVEQLKSQVRPLMTEAFLRAGERLRVLVAGGAVRSRRGDLLASLNTSPIFTETKNTLTARVGFEKFRTRKARIAAYVLTSFMKQRKPNIPKKSKMLAFPTKHSPPDIISKDGVQLMSVGEAARKYKLFFLPTSIIGKRFSRKKATVRKTTRRGGNRVGRGGLEQREPHDRQWKFLFARRDEVKVKKHIFLEREQKLLDRDLNRELATGLQANASK